MPARSVSSEAESGAFKFFASRATAAWSDRVARVFSHPGGTEVARHGHNPMLTMTTAISGPRLIPPNKNHSRPNIISRYLRHGSAGKPGPPRFLNGSMVVP